MKKRMYVVTNLDGDEFYYDNKDDALQALKLEVEGASDEQIEELELELYLDVKLMTDEEIAALPEA